VLLAYAVAMADTRLKPPSSEPAIRVIMTPRDVNADNTIFGGIILSHIDQAGYVECLRQACHRYATIAMDKVEFRKPVFIGDIVSFYACATGVGRTSISIHITVKADRYGKGEPSDQIVVTEADLVYVALDDNRRSVPIFEE